MATRVSAAMLDLPTKPHALYRFYDRTDALLYVGITVNLPGRLKAHRRDKPWWVHVHHISVEHFATRKKALAAEAEAIRTEGPLHNDQHNEHALHDLMPAKLSDIDGQWLLENWQRIPAGVRDYVEVPAWRLGRSELAEAILEDLSPDEVARCAATAQKDVEDDEEADVEDLPVLATVAAFRLAAEENFGLRLALEELLRGVLVDFYTTARTHADGEARRRLGDHYTDSDGLNWLAYSVCADADVRHLRSLPSAVRARWMRATANVTPSIRSKRHLEEAAGRDARRFKVQRILPSNLCRARNGDSTCVVKASHFLRFEDCPYCRSEVRCRGHRGLCERHLHSALETGWVGDNFGERLTVAEYRVASDDPWEV